MKHYKKRVAKIVDELLTYFFLAGAKDMEFKIKDTEDYYQISLISDYLHKEDMEKLCRLLNCPKQRGIEEYYWELTGEGDVDNELSLIGMIIDDIMIDYQENDFIKITIYKYKN